MMTTTDFGSKAVERLRAKRKRHDFSEAFGLGED